jgi:hypothetical protein
MYNMLATPGTGHKALAKCRRIDQFKRLYMELHDLYLFERSCDSSGDSQSLSVFTKCTTVQYEMYRILVEINGIIGTMYIKTRGSDNVGSATVLDSFGQCCE